MASTNRKALEAAALLIGFYACGSLCAAGGNGATVGSSESPHADPRSS